MSLSEQLKRVPHHSGVYRFLNKEGTIIYVGKAKDLKNRVSQYFHSPKQLNAKTLKMVSQVEQLEYTVVDSERDAFLLENNLIKELQPKYNILLKDDKTYPWICIKNEPFPRVFSTRKVVRDGSLYFGPYTNGGLCKQLLTLCHTLFPLRTCRLKLTEEALNKGSYKKCLKAHIGQCLAPCIRGQSEEEYRHYIDSVIQLLKGHTQQVRKQLEQAMWASAKALAFEQAQQYKNHLEALERYQKKSVIVNPAISNVDVFSLVVDPTAHWACGNFMRVVEGAVIHSQNAVLKFRLDETPEQLLGLFIEQMQEQKGPLSREILVPFLPQWTLEPLPFHVPQKGDKRELVSLSLRNAQAQQVQEREPNALLVRLKEDLGMTQLPLHIECFDNSNLMGTHPVASCVVFKNGKPSKKDYRHFSIKTVEGPNDFASMAEVVGRRYRRQTELPQLVVIDGGKGQLSAAYQILQELGLLDRIMVVGLAKRLEEIYRPGSSTPLCLNKASGSLRLLMQLRDEAHRFGITFHRQKRSKNFAQTSLTQIPGIGEKTAQKLLLHFKSVAQIKKASIEELTAVVGPKTALALRTAYGASSTQVPSP